MTTIVQKVTDFYISSRDFNGIPLAKLYEQVGLSESEFKDKIIEGIRNRRIDLIYEGDIPNPHIKPFPAPNVEKQIIKLRSILIEESIKKSHEEIKKLGVGDFAFSILSDDIGCCVYPTPEYLQKVIDWIQYNSRPFTLRLAMGEWQLRPYFFGLGILAIYRNDPRYRYNTDDITGSLSAVSEELRPSDQIHISHFGFGFDDKNNRVVAVLLTDLSRLTPLHQQIWKAKMLGDYFKYKLHPDFRKSILGHFYDGDSIFSAFIEEIKLINEMTIKIKGKPLFNKTFERSDKPENFGFLILPTQRESELFAQTLDRMLSDNINGDFFDTVITEADLGDGEKLTEIKSIRKLEIWLNKTVRFPDPKPKDEMLKTLRDIRRQRSKPAHTYVENEWNQNFFNNQKEFMKKAYRAVRTLRLIFANNPASKDVKVPEWLQNGQIRIF